MAISHWTPARDDEMDKGVRWEQNSHPPNNLLKAFHNGLRSQMTHYLSKIRVRNIKTGETIDIKKLLQWEIHNFLAKEVCPI